MSASGAGVGGGKPRELVASLSLFLICQSMARSDASYTRISYTPFTLDRRGIDLDHHVCRLGDTFEVHIENPSFESRLGLLQSRLDVF